MLQCTDGTLAARPNTSSTKRDTTDCCSSPIAGRACRTVLAAPTDVWRKVTSPAQAAKRLRIGTKAGGVNGVQGDHHRAVEKAARSRSHRGGDQGGARPEVALRIG